MQVSENTVVRFDYTVTDADGGVIDSSEGRDPFAYLYGSSGIIPGLEMALEGRSEGDHFDTILEPSDAYGEWDPELIEEVPRDQFQLDGDLEVGMQFQTAGEHGVKVVTVTAVDDEKVTVDGNHPLAGKTLTFSVDIVEVREPTEEEAAHGHAHGPGHEH